MVRQRVIISRFMPVSIAGIWGVIEVGWSLHWSDGGLHRDIHRVSGFDTPPKTDNQNLIYKVGWLFEKNIEPLVIPLHPTTDIVL